MSIFPEREPIVKAIDERPEEISSLTIERKEVVSPIPTQFQGRVQSDSGQNLIQTPQTQTITIQLPIIQEELLKASKGSVDDSLTWFGAFWLRIIKKAIYFGWRVVTGNKIAGQ